MTHFHVSTISSSVGVPPIVEVDQTDAIVKYEETVQTLMDLTGTDIESTGPRNTNLCNGDKVRWFPCESGCLDER